MPVTITHLFYHEINCVFINLLIKFVAWRPATKKQKDIFNVITDL